MRSLGLGAAIVTVGILCAACSDSLAPESIAGAYTVSVWELTSVETPSRQEEWVSGGVNIQFQIGTDGAFSLTATWGESTSVNTNGLYWQYSGGTLSGTIDTRGSTVTISLPSAPEPGAELVPCSGPISRNGDTLIWTLPDCLARDFGGGTAEPVSLRVVATRRS